MLSTRRLPKSYSNKNIVSNFSETPFGVIPTCMAKKAGMIVSSRFVGKHEQRAIDAGQPQRQAHLLR
jgi:hypothetical protein